jgi:hypothetical protein
VSLTLSYVRLPTQQAESYPRPLIHVQLADMIEAPLACLVDSGAIHNRFRADLANAAGISLEEPDETIDFGAGSKTYTGRIVTVGLKIADFQWDAPVCFVDDWDQNFQVLGHEGFFRWFHVCFYAADEQLSLELSIH